MITLVTLLAAQTLTPATLADLNCAEVAARAMLRTDQGSKARMGATVAHFYYLGRLSVRDDSVNWAARIMSDIDAHPKSDDPSGQNLGTCLGAVTGHMG